MKAAYAAAMERLYLACIVVSAVALVAITLVIPYGVFMRYVMNSASSWPEPFSLLAQNHYLVSKVYTLTGHLIIPEIFIFSKRTWDGLTPDDQALLKKLSREAQLEQRQLWDEKTVTAEADLKAKGVTFVPADKAAYYKATQPIRDKYGVKYAALLKRIEETK